MKHIFIINPAAGQGILQKRLAGELGKRNIDYYLTKRPGDAGVFIRKSRGADARECIRFYACGGDGTLSEVVNGIFGLPNVEAACVPIGSGNDFIRNFGIPKENFKDIDKQLSGSSVPVDVIKYQDTAGSAEAGYAIDMFNIGFDCDVVKRTARVKKYPFISGSPAYLLSILITLIKKTGTDLTICFDDGTEYRGRTLLTAIGNGAFCGGGLKGVPYAALDDGVFDVCVIKDVSRRVFISLFPKYPSGDFVNEKRMKDIVVYKKCRSATVKNVKGTWDLCVDGEIIQVQEVKFEIIPNAVRFSLPRG